MCISLSGSFRAAVAGAILLTAADAYAGKKTARDGHEYNTSTKVDQPSNQGGATFLGKTNPETQFWQKEMDKWRQEVIAATNRLTDELSKTQDFKDRSKGVQEGQEAIDKATADAMAPLRSDPAYAAACKERDELRAQYEKAKREGTATAQEKADLLIKVSKPSTFVNKMEQAALANSEALIGAKVKFASAQTAMRELRERFQATISQDPGWVNANSKLDVAKEKFVEATARANR